VKCLEQCLPQRDGWEGRFSEKNILYVIFRWDFISDGVLASLIPNMI
jgi:hypothetical protein